MNFFDLREQAAVTNATSRLTPEGWEVCTHESSGSVTTPQPQVGLKRRWAAGDS